MILLYKIKFTQKIAIPFDYWKFVERKDVMKL